MKIVVIGGSGLQLPRLSFGLLQPVRHVHLARGIVIGAQRRWASSVVELGPVAELIYHVRGGSADDAVAVRRFVT